MLCAFASHGTMILPHNSKMPSHATPTELQRAGVKLTATHTFIRYLLCTLIPSHLCPCGSQSAAPSHVSDLAEPFGFVIRRLCPT